LKGEATSQCAHTVLMIRPQPRFFMAGYGGTDAVKTKDRLMAMIASHFPIGNSSTGDTNWKPAL